MNLGKIRGFTLIESMIVIAVLVIASALAAPALNSFVIKNRVAAISNEFAAALQQTRALAISKNTCATMCASTTVVADASTSGKNQCSNGRSDDFQKGWVVFVNPACDNTQTDPTAAGGTLTTQRQAQTSGYAVTPSSAALSMIMFDPRGFAAIAASGYYEVTSPSSDATLKRVICIDKAGRTTVRRTLSGGASVSC